MNLIQERSVPSSPSVSVRVRVGPISRPNATAASADKPELAGGGTAFATFKATGTRLVPLA